MLKLHHLQNSRSQRVIWLLEELGLAYEVVTHTREPGQRGAPASLTAVHPLGKAPVLEDGDTRLAETGAIVDYVLEHYGQGRLEPAKDSPERTDYLYWRHFAEATFMPYLAMKLVFDGMEKGAPFFARPIVRLLSRAVNNRYLNPNLFQALDLIEQQLRDHHWMAGEAFSAADILLGFMLEAVCGTLAPASRYPEISRMVKQMQARSAYQIAHRKGHWSAMTHQQYWAFLSSSTR